MASLIRVGILLLVPCVCLADQRARLTLDEAVHLALTGGRAALVARLTRDDQSLALEAEEERYRPTFDVGASAREGRRADASAEVSIGSSLRVPSGGVFRLSWRKPTDQAGKTRLELSQPLLKGAGPDIDTAGLRKARMADRIAEREFRDAVARVVVATISAWRGAARAGRRVEIARSALARSRRQLEVNRTLIDAGRLAAQDLVQSEAEVADREYDLVDAENALEVAYAALGDVLDTEEAGTFELPAEGPLTAVRPDLESSLDTAFAWRTDWLQAELGIELADIDLRLAENSRLLGLSVDVAAERDADTGETDYSALLSLRIPFPDHDARRSLVRAKNGVRRARLARAETRQAIRIAVRRAVDDVHVALRRTALARAARELAARKLDVERRKHRQGLSSAFQLGRFETDLVNAEHRELDAEVGYRNALTALRLALGTTLEHWGIAIERVGR